MVESEETEKRCSPVRLLPAPTSDSPHPTPAPPLADCTPPSSAATTVCAWSPLSLAFSLGPSLLAPPPSPTNPRVLFISFLVRDLDGRIRGDREEVLPCPVAPRAPVTPLSGHSSNSWVVNQTPTSDSPPKNLVLCRAASS